MKKTLYTFILITVVILGTSGIKSVQSSGAAPTGNTGATGTYCNSCHSGNTFNATGGGIAATGLPNGYTLGTAYSFSITINHATANRKRWGFAIKAVNANGTAVGTFSTTNTNAIVSSGELGHKNAPISASGANTFTYNNLKWTAPATNALADKKIRFFIVAVAANGTGGSDADFVYSKLVTVSPATVVKSFTPIKGATGISVTIKGTSFTGTTDVSFGGVIAQSFTVNSDTTITAVVGAGASGDVSVTSPAGTASLAGFTYCAVAPTSTNVNLFGCNSFVFNDSTYFTSAVVRDTIRTVNGCDSVYKKTNITIKSISPTSQSSNQSACDKFIYKNITYNSSTVIKDTLRTQEGCDSVFLTINATVNPSVNGRIYHPTKGVINNVKIVQTGTATNTLTASGNYNASCLAANSNVTLKPSKNNDVTKANGVTGVDALLIQRHILNSNKINNAYKLIGADVDGNKSINSIDVLRVKRLILGTDTTFASPAKGNRLWEFIDSAYVFPDTTNPFTFKDSISFTNLTTNKTNQTFIGVKLGDVDYTWNATVARQIPVNSVELIVSSEKKASIVRHQFSTRNFKEIAAMQYTLNFDNTKYEFVGIENNKIGIDFNEKQATTTGNIAMLWIDKNAASKTLEDGSELFTLVLKSKGLITGNDLTLNNDIAEVQAWDNDFKKYNVVLAKQTHNTPLDTKSLSIYPNPAHSLITVKTDKFICTGTIIITDVYGKEVLKKVINNQISAINVSGFSKGVYMLSILTEQSKQTQKVIIE